MTPLAVWARRSLARWTAPLILGTLVFGTWSRDGWQYEWLWGMRAVVSIMSLVSPVVAASVAFDIARHWHPMVQGLGPSTRRWRHATLAVVLVHILWAFLALCLVWSAAAVRLGAHHALWQPDPWLPMETVASLGAAAGVGLFIGTRVHGLAAPPLAAIIVFGTEVLAAPYGLLSLFVPMTLVNSAVGLERDPTAAVLAVALNLSVAACCILMALRESERSRQWVIAVGIPSVVIVAVIAAPARLTPSDYRVATDQRICVQEGDMSVCGPPNTRTLLRTLGASLNTAGTRLKGSGLPLPHDYVLGLPGTIPPRESTQTIADVSPAQLESSTVIATVAQVLSQPRLCPQLLEPDEDTAALLDREEQIQTWIEHALGGASGAAPPRVRDAYHEILTCSPSP